MSPFFVSNEFPRVTLLQKKYIYQAEMYQLTREKKNVSSGFQEFFSGVFILIGNKMEWNLREFWIFSVVISHG